MKFVSLIVVILSLTISVLQAQIQAPDTMWTRTFGSPGSGFGGGCKVLQTPDEGYIIVGYEVPFGLGVQVYLIKTDANGNAQWEQFYGEAGNESGSGIKMTGDGGYIIVGKGPSPVSYSDVYLLKTDSIGNLIWEREINIQDNDFGSDIDLTFDGGYIICGYCGLMSYPYYRDCLLIKTDSLGNMLWARTYGGNYNDKFYSIRQCPDGGFIMTGFTSDTVYNSDVYLVKTDSAGNIEWERTYGENYYDSIGSQVIITDDGGFIIVGTTKLSNIADTDVFLIKTDSFGNEQWHSVIGGHYEDGGGGVQETIDGGYVITGTTKSFYSGSIVPGGYHSEVYFLKTDDAGVVEWQMILDPNLYDHGADLQQTTDGGFIIVGNTQINGYDVYLAKMEPENLNSSIDIILTPYNPPIQIPAGGGSFQYDLSIVDDGSTPITFDCWIEALLPNERVKIFQTRYDLNILPGDTIFHALTQWVPANAQAGEYKYMAFVGICSNVILDSASFYFEKLAGDDGIGSNFGWELDGWDVEDAFNYTVPAKFALHSPAPNPFNPSTVISYKLQADSYVELVVYDVMGREVARLVDGFSPAGVYEFTFDAYDLPSGVYFVRMKAGGFMQTQKMLLMK